MADFKPGDRVVVVDGPRTGEVTTVVSGPHVYLGRSDAIRLVRGDIVYHLDLASITTGEWGVAAKKDWLRHLPPDAERSAAEVADGLVERAMRRVIRRVRT
jgi:hypothetical protein